MGRHASAPGSQDTYGATRRDGHDQRAHRIVRRRRYDSGSPFASLQAPELLVADLLEACTEQGVLR